MNINPLKWFSKSEPKVKSNGNGYGGGSNGGLSMADVINLSQGFSEKLEADYSCIRDKSETAGMIPLVIYDQDGKKVKRGREVDIFTRKPNDYMTMQTMIELIVYWYEQRGAFYAYKRKNENGNVYEIIPFRFQSNVSAQMDQNGNVYYLYTTNDGKPLAGYYEEDLFIVIGNTTDGFTPISPRQQAASLFESSVAQENNYKELQTNGITSQMALGTDQVFADENKISSIRDQWQEFRGPAGVGRIPIFENGLKPVSLKLTPAETELLKSREFSVNRICRMRRVPLHRVGISDKSDITSIFDLDEAYFRNSIVPILRKIISEIEPCLPKRKNLRIEFNYNAFYAGSPWRMAESVDKVVKGGLKSINEGREDLGLEPVDGGDVYAINNNNVDYGSWNDLDKFNQNDESQTNTNNVEKDSDNEN